MTFIWDPANAAAAAAAGHVRSRCIAALPGWACALEDHGLLVLHSGAEPGTGSCETRVLEANAGLICGRMFRRGREMQSHPHGAPVSVEETARILGTRCGALIEDYWGRYVAIVRDAASSEVHVLRDPTGAMPCFVTRFEHVHIVFSDIEPCLALGLLSFSINWRFIAAYVPYSALQIRETGLQEVAEVQGGERVSFRGDRIDRKLLWNPASAAARGAIEDAEVATTSVRETVRTCVHAWASLHRSIVHNLSGGLDSSIVLSCLADAPNRPAVAALHYFAPASGEDERRFARLTASHLRTELMECALDPAAVQLAKLMQIRRAPRPWFYTYDLEQGPLEVEAAASRRATSIFSGASGDGLFMQPRAEFAVADYLYRRGLRAGVMRVALNAARITRKSMWPILRHGIRQHFTRADVMGLGVAGGARALIRAEVLEAAGGDYSLFHPWLVEAGDIPPGLRWHILCLSVPPAFYSFFDNGGEVERTAVLLSQPLIELCLRIPMSVWISGGRDRSIARDAFAPDLPPAIARRVAKGASDRHSRKIIDAHAGFLREMLLDGLLVRNGVLDRARLEPFLARGSQAVAEYNQVLCQHLCTEVWLRRWSASTISCGG